MADWLPKKDAAQALHCSQRTLEEFCSRGLLIAGEHYYRAGVKAGAMVFDINACRAALLEHTAASSKPKRAKPLPVVYDEQHLDQLIKEARK